MTREQVVEEAKKAHIRGRGGAGFDCRHEVELHAEAVERSPATS